MDNNEFAATRKLLKKTQKALAGLLGISLKAVSSYEQGWRSIPFHVERQLIFLVVRKGQKETDRENCWDLRHCPDEKKLRCPAWEFNSGKLCWFINGTICESSPQKNWETKLDICKKCIVLKGDNSS